MKRIILGAAFALMLAIGANAQDRYGRHQQNTQCWYERDYYGRIYERCQEYRNYGQWRLYHNHGMHRGWHREPRFRVGIHF